MSTTHLVFDLDDTLYPEREYAIGGFRAAAAWAREALGVPISAERMLQLLQAGQLGKLFATVLAEAKPEHSADDLAGLVRAYGRHQPQLTLFPDAAEALQHWSSLGALGLITDGHPRTQQSKLDALGIVPRFRHVILTGALGPDRAFHKPHPRSFELMAAALGGTGDRFVYIGDNPSKDFHAPNALGWMTVQIDRPSQRMQRIHRGERAPVGGEPQHVVASLNELGAIVPTIT